MVLVNGMVNHPEDDKEEHPSPLQIELVLRKVFSYLNLQDLKSCRLVNPYWNRLVIPYMKRASDTISFNRDNYWTNIKNHDIVAMSSFIELIHASTNFPFAKLDIGTSVAKQQSHLPHEVIVASFFQSVCQWVTELCIRDEWGQRLFQHGIPETMALAFPNLEKFTAHFIQPTPDDEKKIRDNFKFIAEILKTAPVLSHLSLIDHNGSDGKVLSLFIDTLETASCRKFSSLEIAAQLENNHLIRLSKMGLKLKSLTLDFWGSVIDPVNLKLFLESQSLTLEHLKIADCAMSSIFEVDFPRLGKLKTLRIKGSVLGRICVSFPNISYVRQFPVLKRLSFSTVMDEWDEFLKFGIEPVTTVEELKLPSDFTDETGVLHAARIFPNIRKLEISALLNIVNIVYESMPNIEELILNTKHVDLVDDILTGLCTSECDEILSFSEEMFHRVEQDHMRIITTKPVSSLERLKILRLKCKRRSDPVELTDVSCRLVLLKMPSLQCLDFWGRIPPSDRVSEHVLSEMKKKFLVYC